MELPLLVLSAVAAIALIALALGLKSRLDAGSPARESQDDWPFCLKRSVLSQREQQLLWRLKSVLPEHLVLAQVQVSQVIEVRSGVADSTRWHNRICQKSFDFVVCTKDAAPVLAIELDDRSHHRRKRMTADATKDRAAEAAGLRLARWNAADLPDAETIRMALPSAGPLPVKGGY